MAMAPIWRHCPAQPFCLLPVLGIGHKISSCKLLFSRTGRLSSRAAALLRLAETTIGSSGTAIGAFYRRLSLRAGKAKAVTATARKISVLSYNSLRNGMANHVPGASQFEEPIPARYRQSPTPRKGHRLHTGRNSCGAQHC